MDLPMERPAGSQRDLRAKLMKVRRHAFLRLAIGVAVAVAAGAALAGVSQAANFAARLVPLSAGPVAAGTPAPAPVGAAAPGPYTWVIVSEGASPTIAHLRQGFGRVVAGTVLSIAAPQWNTPSGQRADPRRDPHVVIYRAATVRVLREIKGGGTAPATLRVRILGGQIGQDKLVVSEAPDLQIGQSYLLFLAPATDAGATASGEFGASKAWPIVNGSVETSLEGTLPLDTLAAQLALP